MPESNGDEVVAIRLTPERQQWLRVRRETEEREGVRLEGPVGDFVRMLSDALPAVRP